jgi:hypothetical protein
LPDRRSLLAQIAPGYLDVTVFGQVPPTQFPLSNHLEPGSLKVERLDAPLGRRALIEEALEDPAGDPHGALIRPQDHGELDGISLIIPASVFRELKEQHLS